MFDLTLKYQLHDFLVCFQIATRFTLIATVVFSHLQYLLAETIAIDCTNAKRPKHLQEKLHSAVKNDEVEPSFNIHPLYVKHLQSTGDLVHRHSKAAHILGPRSCNDAFSSKNSDIAEVHNMYRSSCPWRLVMTVDKHRYPEQMFKAQCICGKCKDMRKSARSQYTCKEIYVPFKVLRQEYINNEKACENNNGTTELKYTAVDELVPVGCTCVKKTIKRTIESSKKPVRIEPQ